MKRFLWFLGGFVSATVILLVIVYSDLKKRESFGGFSLFQTVSGDTEVKEEYLTVFDGSSLTMSVTAREDSLSFSWTTDRENPQVFCSAKYERENDFSVNWIHLNGDGSRIEFTDQNADGIPESKQLQDKDGKVVDRYKIELKETKIH